MVVHESCIERRATETELQRQIYRVRETVKTAETTTTTTPTTTTPTTTTTTTKTWRGAASQLTGKLELYILDRHWQELPPELFSLPCPAPSLLHRFYLQLIASANNNLCVVSGQKAVSATGNIFNVCFSCLTLLLQYSLVLVSNVNKKSLAIVAAFLCCPNLVCSLSSYNDVVSQYFCNISACLRVSVGCLSLGWVFAVSVAIEPLWSARNLNQSLFRPLLLPDSHSVHSVDSL